MTQPVVQCGQCGKELDRPDLQEKHPNVLKIVSVCSDACVNLILADAEIRQLQWALRETA